MEKEKHSQQLLVYVGAWSSLLQLTLESRENTFLGADNLSLAVCVCDDMNKASICGRCVQYVICVCNVKKRPVYVAGYAVRQ